MPYHFAGKSKNYVSIHVCVILEDKTLEEKYKKNLDKLSKGVSFIRFKKIEKINPETF